MDMTPKQLFWYYASVIAIFFIGALAIAGLNTALGEEMTQTYYVDKLKVIDGDTIEAEIEVPYIDKVLSFRSEKVRFVGYDAYESKHRPGTEVSEAEKRKGRLAAAELDALLRKGRLLITIEHPFRDSFGRILARGQVRQSNGKPIPVDEWMIGAGWDRNGGMKLEAPSYAELDEDIAPRAPPPPSTDYNPPAVPEVSKQPEGYWSWDAVRGAWQWRQYPRLGYYPQQRVYQYQLHYKQPTGQDLQRLKELFPVPPAPNGDPVAPATPFPDHLFPMDEKMSDEDEKKYLPSDWHWDPEAKSIRGKGMYVRIPQA
jgi:endonuclease YncB( thermonuclease family)